jgi:hypothetical protein
MFLKNTFLLLILATNAYAQQTGHDDVLQKAINHRQIQHAAHVILWDAAPCLLNIDTFFVDQAKGTLTVQCEQYLVKYNIKILGTYDHHDSTFLWSIYNESILKELTTPVAHLITIAKANQLKIPTTRRVRCSFDSAYKLATLAFYFDQANGIKHIMTNNRRTNVFFTFYDVEVFDKATKKLVMKVPVKKQYQMADAPGAIALCRRYVAAFGANENKYYQLYQKFNKDHKYLDTMFANRVKISDTYWDTTSVRYVFFRRNRLQGELSRIINWRAVNINGNIYVLYDEKEPWGAIKTWAFKINQANNKIKIGDEYVSF